MNHKYLQLVDALILIINSQGSALKMIMDIKNCKMHVIMVIVNTMYYRYCLFQRLIVTQWKYMHVIAIPP